MTANEELQPLSGKPLRPRELEILIGFARGLTGAEIGLELGIQAATVKSHARRIFIKLGAHSRVQAVAIAWRTGVLGLDDLPDPRIPPQRTRDSRP